MKSLFIRGALIAFLLSPWAAAQSVRTIFLVRHGEQASGVLGPAGQKRADCLEQMLKDAGIKQIFVTELQASQQTAAPLARTLKLTPAIIPAKDPNRLISNLAYARSPGNVLVVAPNDVLPFVIARMKAGTVPPIGENEYDRMFVVTENEGSATPVTTLHYCSYGPGAPAAKPAATPAAQKKPAARAPAKKK